nr:NAD-dependent epimerase/dehydratase family protein [Microbispora sp. ATCC PTA-5024]
MGTGLRRLPPLQRAGHPAAARGLRRSGRAPVVLASSSSVYGGSDGTPSRESDLPCPRSPYGVTKLAAERLALAYASRPDAVTEVVALRYFTVYGPRQRSDMAIGRVLRAALTGRPLRLYGDGLQRRDFTYVGDAVAATIAAASAPARAEAVNVGGGTSVSTLDMLRRGAEITGRDVPVVREAAQPGDVEATDADLTKARDLLGYQPAVPLTEGMERQWRWLLARDAVEGAVGGAVTAGLPEPAAVLAGVPLTAGPEGQEPEAPLAASLGVAAG